MNGPDCNDQLNANSGRLFVTTSWDTVFHARNDGPVSSEALERLLRRYYRPIEGIILLQQRCSLEDARDITQEFFNACLRRDFLRDVAPAKGRFRTFIRRCLENFLRDLNAKRFAQKRGSGAVAVSLQEAGEDGQPLLEPVAAAEDPWIQLDREWARQVVASALAGLQQECSTAQRLQLFGELRDHLTGRAPPRPAVSMSADLGMTETALNVARHRLRQRLGDLVVEEVKATMTPDADWREELRYLMQLIKT